MLNAGSGFHMGLDGDLLQTWKPSLSSQIFLYILGLLLTVPGSIFIFSIVHLDIGLGLIEQMQEMWQHKIQAVAVTLFSTSLFCAFSWLRAFFIWEMRDYELLRWFEARDLVGAASDQSKKYLAESIKQFGQSKPQAKRHYLDEPYNYRLMLFGHEAGKVEKSEFVSIESVKEESVKEAIFIETTEHYYRNFFKAPSSNEVTDLQVETLFDRTVEAFLLDPAFTHNVKSVAGYIGLQQQSIEKKLFYSDCSVIVKDLFKFDLENRSIFQSVTLLGKNQRPDKVPIQISARKFTLHTPELLSCYNCDQSLSIINSSVGEVGFCASCHGYLFSETSLQALYGQRILKKNWQDKQFTFYKGYIEQHCFNDCKSPMNQYQLNSSNPNFTPSRNNISILRCPQCSLYWFDEGQIKGLLELTQYENLAQQEANQNAGGTTTYIAQLLTGLPFKVYNPVKKIPTVLVSLLLVMGVIFLLQQSVDKGVSFVFLLYPDQVLYKPWALISSAFMHANLFHLAGNGIMLWLFGDNIEDKYGWKTFLLIFLLSAIVGNLVHVAANFGSSIGCLGASGGVYGIMAAYLVFFKSSKVWWVVLFVRVKVSLVLFLLFRIGVDIYGLLFSIENIAWFAHIGGFLTGLCIGYLVKNQTLKNWQTLARIAKTKKIISK